MKIHKGAFSALAIALLMAGLPVVSQPSGELNNEILAQDGKDITFYGRVFDLEPGNPMPMNTQFPDGENDYSRGWSGGCGAPPPAPDDSADCENWEYNELFWYTTAGFVQIKDSSQFAYDKLHNERGQTKDIYLDTSKQPQSTLYMSADFHGWAGTFSPYGVGWNWDPGYYEDWVVETWVWHANLGPWSSDPDAKPDVREVRQRGDGATLIAQGTSEPTSFWSLDPTLPLPNAERTVWPFSAGLAWDPAFVESGGVVPYLNDLIVEFEWYQLTDGQKYIISPDWVVGGLTWNLNAGEDYPNNVVLPVRNPLDVELVFPRFIHDKLVVLSVLNTPWGSYDVDLNSIDIEFRKASGATVTPSPEHFQKFIDVSVAHSGHYDPINLTWIWSFQEDGLDAGDYEIVVSANNFQGSAYAETVATFTIEKDGTGGEATAAQSGLLSFNNEQFRQYQEGVGAENDSDGGAPKEEVDSKGSPGPAIPAMAAGLFALAFLRRQRA